MAGAIAIMRELRDVNAWQGREIARLRALTGETETVIPTETRETALFHPTTGMAIGTVELPAVIERASIQVSDWMRRVGATRLNGLKLE